MAKAGPEEWILQDRMWLRHLTGVLHVPGLDRKHKCVISGHRDT
jgi:hypothetical protein